MRACPVADDVDGILGFRFLAVGHPTKAGNLSGSGIGGWGRSGTRIRPAKPPRPLSAKGQGRDHPGRTKPRRLCTAAQARFPHRHAAQSAQRRRRAHDHCGHPRASGHRELHRSTGSGSAVTPSRACARVRARPLSLSRVLSHAGCQKHHAWRRKGFVRRPLSVFKQTADPTPCACESLSAGRFAAGCPTRGRAHWRCRHGHSAPGASLPVARPTLSRGPKVTH